MSELPTKTTENSECKSCKHQMNASDKFCPKCGVKAFKVMRSENEIKCLRERIFNQRQNPDTKIDPIMRIIMVMPMTIVIDWVLGSDIDPVSLLEKMEEKKLP